MFKSTIKTLSISLVLAGSIAAPQLSAAELLGKSGGGALKISTVDGKSPSKKVVSRQRINNDDWQGTQVTYADGSQHCYDEDNQMSCYGGCPCQ